MNYKKKYLKYKKKYLKLKYSGGSSEDHIRLEYITQIIKTINTNNDELEDLLNNMKNYNTANIETGAFDDFSIETLDATLEILEKIISQNNKFLERIQRRLSYIKEGEPTFVKGEKEKCIIMNEKEDINKDINEDEDGDENKNELQRTDTTDTIEQLENILDQKMYI